MAYRVKYIGTGFLPGVPAADHEVETKKELKALIDTGLYEDEDEDPKVKKAKEDAEKAAKAEANAKDAAAKKAAAEDAAEAVRIAKEELDQATRSATASMKTARRIVDGKS